jgi:hypothetical protein
MTDVMARRITGTSAPSWCLPVTAADPGRHLLDKIDAREQALAREAGQAQAQVDELIARLRELSEAISDLQVTRKTLISLAGHDDEPAAEPAGPSPCSLITPPTSRSSLPSPTSACRVPKRGISR